MIAALRTPRGLATALILLVLAALPLLTQAFDQRYLLSIGTRIVIWSIAAVSLNMILGYGGLVSFGHAMFFGIGGYAIGILSAEGISSGWIQWPVALLAATAWAVVIGALSLRTRGLYFIMITLAFAQLVYYVGSGLEAYGGDDGLNISRSRFPGLIDLRDKASFYWLCFALLCASLWFCGRYANSRFGLVIRGAKSNELRMTALGFPVFRYRLAAFTIAGALGGLSGILLANEGAYVSPAMMSWMKSGDLIVIVVLGGMGTLFGPLYGTIAFFVLEEALPPILNLAHKGWGEYWMIVFGPLLVLIALYARGGIDSLLGRRHD
ncbi:branched-chain amino acid ABC transporter permease [Reyranella sp.]|jgi:branched-chain amino acid transport system permease protein|uniref:branched-chain amino acid ABC transporter permease n=1 Tax=Reyranella sp. TaxID=1929291 RepID=UPI000BD9EE42|nr:branched-chain amino acid ABC transporter permease [Reyranella sp.]OYY42637.1 MAG: branched-chain amino acid ABC transporter permease [Rhodospirillales bacterium 35-66-84]OYZ94417.1 MAG: branched-chain amino acid ABC transporter permease [Rhodospirillales bacterium 24-66-33]OZB25339.1 MAG: branched-chain amino acid ABC transporter permease [Rhodospirillales bacterium 39-66-50]HQS16471.1 branched-chain amino acid ABC transporter permease [Reyranella sp.]HQT13429.1 branched-chain amino acid A